MPNPIASAKRLLKESPNHPHREGLMAVIALSKKKPKKKTLEERIAYLEGKVKSLLKWNYTP